MPMPSRAQSRVTQYRQQHLPLPVDKSNELARAKIDMDSSDNNQVMTRIDVENSALVNKLFHLLIAELNPNAFPTVEVNAKELYGGELNGRQYKDVKKACRALGKAQVEKVYYETGSMPDFDFDNIFHKIRYQSGKIVAKFVDDMKPHLLELKGRFTRLNYFELVALPSYYSQRVYEILKSWASEGVTDEISLEDFHEMISFPKNLRNNFWHLKKKVLDKAVLDIHKKTSLVFSWKPTKQGKKVVGIQFTIGAKGQGIEAHQGRAKPDDATVKAHADAARRKKHLDEASLCRKNLGLVKHGVVCYKKRPQTMKCKLCPVPPAMPLLPGMSGSDTKIDKIQTALKKMSKVDIAKLLAALDELPEERPKETLKAKMARTKATTENVERLKNSFQ